MVTQCVRYSRQFNGDIICVRYSREFNGDTMCAVQQTV